MEINDLIKIVNKKISSKIKCEKILVQDHIHSIQLFIN